MGPSDWFGGGKTKGIAVDGCPAIVEYTRIDQAKAADELALLPKPSMLERFMTDYRGLRAQARACRETEL